MKNVIDSDAKFWGEISLVGQSALLAMINMIFEITMEFFTLYEKWDHVPVFYERLFSRLLNLEFFCTAFITPVIISIYRKDEVIFGVIKEDNANDPHGHYQPDWYKKCGEQLMIQIMIFFFVNNIMTTYCTGVLPFFLKIRRDKRPDYSEKDRLNDIPNTKQET